MSAGVFPAEGAGVGGDVTGATGTGERRNGERRGLELSLGLLVPVAAKPLRSSADEVGDGPLAGGCSCCGLAEGDADTEPYW